MGILIVHLSKKNYLKKTYSKKKLMKIKKLILPNTFIIEPKVFYDKRGFLYEIWSQDLYFKNKIKFKIVQVLHSYSKKNTLRGIHFQYPNLQGRLISIINGKIFDVIVDIRKNSPTFGKWCGCIIDSKKKQQLWIPEGFGHGYLVLSKTVDIIYKCTGKFFSNKQRTIVWNDPDIGIKWPIEKPILSKKDSTALKLSQHKNLPKWKKTSKFLHWKGRNYS